MKRIHTKSGSDEERDNAEPPAPDYYEVGYRKPPRHTRFKKGHSGNPKGRPKGFTSARSLLESALSAPITITESGQPRVIQQRDALFKALVARAIKGDARAAELVIKLMDQLKLNVEPQNGITKIIRTIVSPTNRG